MADFPYHGIPREAATDGVIHQPRWRSLRQMNTDTPTVTRVYQNHHLDSTRWEVYEPRDDDLIITTSLKSGTTWSQLIVLQLLHGHQDRLPDVLMMSPWPDARFLGTTKEQLAQQLESIESQRFIKSHLPLDGLPYHPQVKYLIVGRDPRDVFMSLFNHYSAFTDIAYAAFNNAPELGAPLLRCPEDPRELWRDWIARGWFDWESEGYPMWANLGHTQSYWGYKHLPNFMFLHYNDMLADLEGCIRRIAGFIGVTRSDAEFRRITRETTFATVKQKMAATSAGDKLAVFFRGGESAFFFKGTNERWRGVLTEEDLQLYEAAKERVLTPDCARWLENGGPI